MTWEIVSGFAVLLGAVISIMNIVVRVNRSLISLEETVRRLYSVRLRKDEEVKRQRVATGITENVGGDGTVKKQPKKVQKIGRNDPCPCGSGLKWKKCTCSQYHSN